jgi:hypothetical protein
MLDQLTKPRPSIGPGLRHIQIGSLRVRIHTSAPLHQTANRWRVALSRQQRRCVRELCTTNERHVASLATI